ncbi:MAG: tetratricopeptide repeat protein, partial [Flavobacteriales bacterium]
FIKEATDDATKRAWLDSLYMVYDQRAVYYPELKGECIGKKAYYLYRTAGKDISDEELIQANKWLKESYDVDGNNITGTTINYLFKTSISLINKKIYDVNDVVSLYATLSDVVSYQKAKYGQEKFAYDERIEAGETLSTKEAKLHTNVTKKLDQLAKVESNLETKLAPFATCEKLEEIYGKALEENKANVDWLTKASGLMKSKKCTESDLFFQIAENLYALDPTAPAAINLAYKALKDKDYATTNTYIDKALELEADDLQKAKYMILKANIQLSRGQYQTAYATARKAASLRKGWGEPYLVMGQAYAATSRKCGELKTEFLKRVGYCAALDKFEYARRIDPGVAKAANRLIGSYSKHVPSITQAHEVGKKAGDKHTINCWYNETTTVRTTSSN